MDSMFLWVESQVQWREYEVSVPCANGALGDSSVTRAQLFLVFHLDGYTTRTVLRLKKGSALLRIRYFPLRDCFWIIV